MEGFRRRSRSRRRICSRLESLPYCVFIDGVLNRLDIQTRLTVACVSSKLRSMVSQALTDLPSLQITEFFPKTETLGKIVSRCKGLKTLTVDCLRVSDGGLCIIDGLGPNLEELKLLRSSFIDSLVLHEIGERCPNLRLLVLEMCECTVAGFTGHLSEMVSKCIKLEIRARTGHSSPIASQSIEYVNFLPKTIKSLTLEPLNEGQAVALVSGGPKSTTSISLSFLSTLQKLSLVLEKITDKVVSSITTSIPHLLELHLQDEPFKTEYARELTNAGLETLRNCCHLKSLFLKALAKKGMFEGSCNRPLRKLDIRGCDLLSDVSLKFFNKPFFRQLWWIGVYGTCFNDSETNFLSQVTEEKSLLAVCITGCRMGCYKKWNYFWHKVPSYTDEEL